MSTRHRGVGPILSFMTPRKAGMSGRVAIHGCRASRRDQVRGWNDEHSSALVGIFHAVYTDPMERPRYLTGHFLISETELEDPNFKETVVFLVDHSEEGAFGLVVNRMSQSTLGEVFEEFADHPAASIPIFVGGPVEPHYLFILYAGLPEGIRSEHAREPLGGIVFEPDFKPVSDYLKGDWLSRPPEDKGEIKFFAGYAGWGAGQLEQELEINSWVILPGTDELIFASHPEEGWREALRKKGGVYWIAAETGYKPSMN